MKKEITLEIIETAIERYFEPSCTNNQCNVPIRLYGTACEWLNAHYSPIEPVYAKLWRDAHPNFMFTNEVLTGKEINI